MFLISSHHHSKYGFGILSQTITAVLPKRQREVHALAFTQRLNAEICISSCYMCLSCRGNHRRWYRAVTKRNLLLEEKPLRLPEERLDNFSLLSINTQNKVKALSTIFGCAARIGALQCSPCSTGHCQKRTHLIPFIGVAVASTFFFRSNILLSANTERYRKTRYWGAENNTIENQTQSTFIERK